MFIFSFIQVERFFIASIFLIKVTTTVSLFVIFGFSDFREAGRSLLVFVSTARMRR